MPYLKKSEARRAYQQYIANNRLQAKTAHQVLREATERLNKSGGTFDVFLSHSIKDAELVIGVKEIIEAEGLTVYVDWIDDPQLDRSRVTPETAAVLRSRMNASGSIIYLATNNAADSKWMSWELGYFDGARKSVGILPLLEDYEATFDGMEFVGLYPKIDRATNTSGQVKMWANRKDGSYSLVENFARDGQGVVWRR